MAQVIYRGSYEKFVTASEMDAARLLNADTIVGDELTISFDATQAASPAVLVNRFGAEVGTLTAAVSKRIRIDRAEGLTVRAFLSFVAYSDTEEGKTYWGHVALIAYNQCESAAFEAYAKGLCEALGEGRQPVIELGKQGIINIVQSGGNWISDKSVAYPKDKSRTVIMKKSRSFKDNMVEKGRQGNKGCYLVSILFLVAVAALIIWLISRFFF